MFNIDWKKEIFTIPNLLSLFRIALIPVYMVIYLKADQNVDYYIAAAILTVSCLTDLIDGKIARHFNMISNVGRLLDPLADKATQLCLILCLCIKYPILWAIVVLFVVKEVFQLVAIGIGIKQGKMLYGALVPGKICTTVLFLSLIVLVIFPSLSDLAVGIIALIDAAVMLYAFIVYIFAYFGKNKKIYDISFPQEQ